MVQHKRRKKVVVIGGGTGTFTVLTGLKKHPFDLTAVVAMADDGGSTGILRDELGVLPPGDVRQCLVALSASDRLMRELMSYRFASGGLKGHNFGNILLSALEKVSGSFDAAVGKAAEILRIEGEVHPATLDRVTLVAGFRDGKKVRGQNAVHGTDLGELAGFTLEPEARANPKAVRAILEAHAVVIGPGDFYSSLIPGLLVRGIPEALQKTKAKKIYVANLMTKEGHTHGFSVHDFADRIEDYIGTRLDFVIYNNRRPPVHLARYYAREGEHPVSPISFTDTRRHPWRRYVGGDFINWRIKKPKPGDPLVRNLIRHNPDRLARAIFSALA